MRSICAQLRLGAFHDEAQGVVTDQAILEETSSSHEQPLAAARRFCDRCGDRLDSLSGRCAVCAATVATIDTPDQHLPIDRRLLGGALHVYFTVLIALAI